MGLAASRRGQATVHPHARGDNARDAGAEHEVPGSPPRAWGQCVHQVKPPQAPTVHPHARGDNDFTVPAENGGFGSPPRAWGQFHMRLLQLRLGRFTPTRVGTISPAPAQSRRLSVHPHARGDNTHVPPNVIVHVGSPPRAWGQCQELVFLPLHHRFTPTRVGTMWRAARAGTAGSVHPHARGDNVVTLGGPPASSGSPPRAWGQWNGPASDTRGRRFTPTRVGTMLT